MFVSLFFKECREILKSITYYIFLGCLIFYFITQIGTFNAVTKPIKGQENYGFKYGYDEDIIVSSTLNRLANELKSNSFTTYPFMFYKEVKLNKEEINTIYEILENLTGINKEKLINQIENYNNSDYDFISIGKNIIFEDFINSMNKIEKIIGKGSYYSEETLYKSARVPKNYEDALNDYNMVINKDKVTRAYARLFGDYMGIILAILPVFLSVNISLKDRKENTNQIIFSKKCSSYVIILSRYLAIIFMIIIPLIFISITPTLQSIYLADSYNVSPDYFAFIKVIFGWLLPTIIVVSSLGILLTEITNTPIAIFVQCLWWFLSVLSSGSNLVGNVGMKLIPRFNSLITYEAYNRLFDEFVLNRVYYSLLGIVLIIITIFVYDIKRKGKLNLNGKIFKNS